MEEYHFQKRKFLQDLLKSKLEFRELDGSNNNSKNPTYGESGQHFLRLGPHTYADGKNTPAGPNRPSARIISNAVFKQPRPIPEPHSLNNNFWLWGQFLDHTITLTGTSQETFHIEVPVGDEFFDPMSEGNKIINFHRSLIASGTGQNSTPREQFNILTPLIDASMVYGHTKERSDYLRTFKCGKLRISEGNLLPLYTGTLDNAGPSQYGSFIGGDIRCNEHSGLTSLHILFVREHNYWANELHCANPHLDDECLFQTAKIIVEAEIQSITWYEFLPLLLSREELAEYQGFNVDVNPQLFNSFSAAAYRFGHSMVSADIFGRKKKLKDTFFSSHLICNEGGIDPIIKAFICSRAEKLDAKLVDDLRNFLFGKPGNGGHDLAALNIQRGRDHGLPHYKQMRQLLGLSPVSVFDHLGNGNSHLKIKLRDLYNNNDEDVDLFVGGLLEPSHNGSLLGEVFHKIVKDQFHNIRDGDRFWFEDRLNSKQQCFVRKQTLATIIDRNTGLHDTHPDIFHFRCCCPDCHRY